ncbi:MAG: DUF5615 family PIN-like protein [Cyanobacteria bacterium P01_F01_bin.13]
MKILIDMNLSPTWVAFFAKADIEAVHWATVGDPRAPDRDLIQWAQENDHVVFTHDLDFGALLAVTQATAPSVFQVRTQDTLPDAIGELVLMTLQQFREELASGALVTIDAKRMRVRVLPINR